MHLLPKVRLSRSVLTFRYCVRWDLEDFVEDFDLRCSVLWRLDAVGPAKLSQDGRRLLCITPLIVTITGESSRGAGTHLMRQEVY